METKVPYLSVLMKVSGHTTVRGEGELVCYADQKV